MAGGIIIKSKALKITKRQSPKSYPMDALCCARVTPGRNLTHARTWETSVQRPGVDLILKSFCHQSLCHRSLCSSAICSGLVLSSPEDTVVAVRAPVFGVKALGKALAAEGNLVLPAGKHGDLNTQALDSELDSSIRSDTSGTSYNHVSFKLAFHFLGLHFLCVK